MFLNSSSLAYLFTAAVVRMKIENFVKQESNVSVSTGQAVGVGQKAFDA